MKKITASIVFLLLTPNMSYADYVFRHNLDGVNRQENTSFVAPDTGNSGEDEEFENQSDRVDRIVFDPPIRNSNGTCSITANVYFSENDNSEVANYSIDNLNGQPYTGYAGYTDVMTLSFDSSNVFSGDHIFTIVGFGDEDDYRASFTMPYELETIYPEYDADTEYGVITKRYESQSSYNFNPNSVISETPLSVTGEGEDVMFTTYEKVSLMDKQYVFGEDGYYYVIEKYSYGYTPRCLNDI